MGHKRTKLIYYTLLFSRLVLKWDWCVNLLVVIGCTCAYVCRRMQPGSLINLELNHVVDLNFSLPPRLLLFNHICYILTGKGRTPHHYSPAAAQISSNTVSDTVPGEAGALTRLKTPLHEAVGT
jgi:hypothetical protein